MSIRDQTRNSQKSSLDGSALFVMPRVSTAWSGAAALWITAAGWARAAEDCFANSKVLTPDGVWSPEDALQFTNPVAKSKSNGALRSAALRFMPDMAKTAIKDILLAVRAVKCTRTLGARSFNPRPRLVWQHHDPFSRIGERIARANGAPLVLYVHAPLVWEGARWGVTRPGWGSWIERFGESPAMRGADLVACVSDEVAKELPRFGVPSHKVLVSPMSVDARRFNSDVDRSTVRRRFGLDNAFVVGWTGSFRKFHGLEHALHAIAQLRGGQPRIKLFLVGDGQERRALASLAETLGMSDNVVFAGSVPHPSMPEYVAAMDAALVVARQGQAFHYSPLKLREYWACGKPVVVPRIGELERVVAHGENGLLFEPGDTGELSSLVRSLANNPQLAARLGRSGAQHVAKTGTWNVQLVRALQSLSQAGWSLPVECLTTGA